MSSLFLIDIENLCGTGMPTASEIRKARSLLLFLGNANETTDTFVIGTHPGRIEDNVREAWPATDANGRNNREGFTYAGKDGGDKAISHWVSKYHRRFQAFDRIVIASGDRHFYSIAADNKNKKLLQVCGVGYRHGDFWDLELEVKFFHDLLPGIRDANLDLTAFSQAHVQQAIDKASKGKKSKSESRKPASPKQKRLPKSQVQVTKILKKQQSVVGNSKGPWPLKLGNEVTLQGDEQILLVRLWARKETEYSDGVISTNLNSSLAEMLGIMNFGDRIGLKINGVERTWLLSSRD